MKVFSLPYSEKLHFSGKDIAYINSDKKLMKFAAYSFDESELTRAISRKSGMYGAEMRSVLVEGLTAQYEELDYPGRSKELLDRLGRSNTFTVCTAHQPCLFTGPLYVIYKIISTIHLTGRLNKKHPDKNFIPVFVSGGEDHDLEEVNHLHIYGKKVSWEPGLSGPVGRMPVDGLEEVIDQIEEFGGRSPFAKEAIELLRNSLEGAKNYGHSFRKLIAKLFEDTDLLVVNMDSPLFKRQFIEIMRDDIFKNTSEKLVRDAQEELEKSGFGNQAYARQINLFYFFKGDRLRIEFRPETNRYELVDGNFSFSAEEIEKELEVHPENFSPNVVLRPMYQELLLPNIAYVGGGGEIAYWLERKTQFEHYGIHYPMLIRRNSVFWLDHIATRNLNQLGMDAETVFSNADELVREYVQEVAGEEISLEEERHQLESVFRSVESKAEQLEKSIIKTIKAEEVKHLKSLEHLEHKLLKAKKQQLDVKVNKITKTHEKLFPAAKPQERFDNFLMYYFRLGPAFTKSLLEQLDPFKKEVIVFQEDDF